MKFKSRIDLAVYLLIYSGIAVMLIPLFPMLIKQPTTGGIVIAVFCLAISGLMLWMLYGTWYTIDNTHVTYHSGLLKGKIAIEKIHTVISDKSLYIGFGPATAHKGIIIKYEKYDEIYFSPRSNETFIAELLKIKPEIKVVKN